MKMCNKNQARYFHTNKSTCLTTSNVTLISSHLCTRYHCHEGVTVVFLTFQHYLINKPLLSLYKADETIHCLIAVTKSIVVLPCFWGCVARVIAMNVFI